MKVYTQEEFDSIEKDEDCAGGRVMSEKVELKPCPFCGEKENIDYGLMTGTMRGFDYVQCEKCGALIHAIHIGNEIKAIEAWNRRANNG